MDYAATYINAKLRFFASDKILHVDTDVTYLVQDNHTIGIWSNTFLVDIRYQPQPSHN